MIRVGDAGMGRRWQPRLCFAATCEGPPKRDLVGVFEVAADGQTAGEPGDLDAERAEQTTQVCRRRLAFDVGVECEDDFLDLVSLEAVEKLGMLRSAGPTLAIGLMTPPSTWYWPRYSRVRSMLITSSALRPRRSPRGRVSGRRIPGTD